MPDGEMRGWRGVVGNEQFERRIGRLRMHRLQRLANADMQVHWSVTDGILVHDGQGKNIATMSTYRNFELHLEYKLSPGADTGVYLRGVPQVQIWDVGEGRPGAGVGSGGLHHNRQHPSKPTVVADLPAGQWNCMYIRMVDSKVTVILNGKTVTENVPLENHWNETGVLPTVGPIEIQASSSPVYFRTLCVRRIED